MSFIALASLRYPGDPRSAMFCFLSGCACFMVLLWFDNYSFLQSKGRSFSGRRGRRPLRGWLFVRRDFLLVYNPKKRATKGRPYRVCLSLVGAIIDRPCVKSFVKIIVSWFKATKFRSTNSEKWVQALPAGASHPSHPLRGSSPIGRAYELVRLCFRVPLSLVSPVFRGGGIFARK